MAGFFVVLRLREWFFVVAVVVMFSGVLAAAAGEKSSEGALFDLPFELEDLIVDAAEVCGGDDALDSGCVEAACLWADRDRRENDSFLQEFLGLEGEVYRSVLVERWVRFLPYDFLCRAVHMAELARLAAVLADRYGSEFWEGVDYEREGVFDEGSFWWLRDHITFSPWEPLRVYFSFVSDDPDESRRVLFGPVLGAPRWSLTVGRWLNKMQDWGFVGSNTRLTFSRLSDQFVTVIDSLLGSIGSLTEMYDSWPVDVPYDPEYRIEYYPTTGAAVRPAMYSVTLESWGYILPGLPDSDESDNALEVYEVCSSAITAAKVRTPDWENKIGECRKAAQDCSAVSGGSEDLCNKIPVLAQRESNWQKLPEVCQSTENKDTEEDQCELAIKEICRYKRPTFLRFLGSVTIRKILIVPRLTVRRNYKSKPITNGPLGEATNSTVPARYAPIEAMSNVAVINEAVL